MTSVFAHHQRHCELGDRVLAAWFDNAAFRAAWRPEPALFFMPGQREIARVAASVGAELDADQLVLLLDRAGKLALFPGGVDDVNAIVRAPFELEPWARLEELRLLAARRVLRERLLDALASVQGDKALGEIQSALSEAARPPDGAARAVQVRSVLADTYERSLAAHGQSGQRTISEKIDQATGGLLPGVVWVLAAGTSWGKSSHLCAVVDRVLRDGGRPLVISCEDPLRLYGRRLIQIRAGVSARRLRDGTLLDSEHRYVADVVQRAEEAPVFLDAIGRPAEAIASDIRSLVRSEGVTVVLVDYVQAMRAQQAKENRRLDVYHCGRLMFDAIKDAGASGILYSQLTEDVATGKLRARDCEDLHNASEVLLFGRTEEEAQLDAHGKKIGKAIRRWVWVDKAKEGPAKFRVDLNWDATSACFLSDYDDPRAARDLFDDQFN